MARGRRPLTPVAGRLERLERERAEEHVALARWTQGQGDGGELLRAAIERVEDDIARLGQEPF